jgi:hypothetical protein
MNMPSVHWPSIGVTIFIVVIILGIYHFAHKH